VCERRVNLLVYSLSLHRHSYVGFILVFTSSIHDKQTHTGNVKGTNVTNGTNGKGWTGGTYVTGTGTVSFPSNDPGYVFTTGDLRGVEGNGKGWTGTTYCSGTGKVSFTSTDPFFGFDTGGLRGGKGLGFKFDTGDLRGSIGPQDIQDIQGIQGLIGPEGPVGPEGIHGIQGIQGIQGPAGSGGVQKSTLTTNHLTVARSVSSCSSVPVSPFLSPIG
jgi:hypothetical protein